MVKQDEATYATPVAKFLAVNPDAILLNTTQVCDLLEVTRGTWTAWVSRGLAPKHDEKLGGAPVWRIKTLIEYARHAPGGRYGYTVG